VTGAGECSCARCGDEVDRHDAYVIGYSKKAAMGWVYLCRGCEAGLREWLAEDQGQKEIVPSTVTTASPASKNSSSLPSR
jgi:hypothetical protein